MTALTTASATPAPRPESVCAVVVTYHTGEGIRKTLAPLLAQVDRILLVDNGSDPETLTILQRLVQTYPQRVELLQRQENNLAAAQNDGIRQALALGYGWVLLMDHDSIAEADMVATLMQARQHYPQAERIGLIAPCLQDNNSRRPARYPQAYGRFFFHRKGFGEEKILDHLLGVIASGSLIPAHIFPQVGLMDESLGIDYVDKEFCLRVIEGGYRIIAVRDAVLHHCLGQCRDYTLTGTGIGITTTNHSPKRRYSIYRNRLKSWAKHGRRVPSFVLYDLCSVGYDLLRVLCFEDQKYAKLRAMGRGVYDACTEPSRNPS